MQILHNIKHDNILLSEEECVSSFKYHVVLCDPYRKTDSTNSVSLSTKEGILILPVHGKSMQTIYSDMYAIGVLFRKLTDHDCFSSLSTSVKNDLAALSEKYRAIDHTSRPSATQCMETIKQLMMQV